jgi:hypothetical protein
VTRKGDGGGIGVWLAAIVFLAAVFAAYRVGSLYIDHATIENRVADVALRAHVTPRRVPVKSEIQKIMRYYDVDLEPEDIDTAYSEGGKLLTIEFTYFRTANLIVYQWPIEFELFIEKWAPHSTGMIRRLKDRVEDSYEEGADRVDDALDGQ